MPPIRVGLVGLTTVSAPGGTGGWTMVSHLPSLLESPHYEIVAIQNSTVESAKRSIEFHNLGASVKAYGNPQDLANDPEVDLVVVSVKLPLHYEITKPAILAGKDVFVEWPLGVTTAEAEELSKLAKERGVKTMVGLQGRADPLVQKLKEVINSGDIGKVISSTVVSTFQHTTGPVWPASVKRFFEKDSGVNVVSVLLGHYFTSFLGALGTFEKLSSVLETQYPTVNLISPGGEIVTKDFVKTVPDHIFIQGKMDSGAIVSLNFRPSEKTVDGKGFRWIIGGTKGEIEITTPEIVFHQMDGGATVRIRRGGSEIEEVDYSDPSEPGHVTKVEGRAKNTARLYEAFATGRTERYPTFEQATEEHHFLDLIYQNAL